MMFNPSEHLMQLSGKDYLEVKYRLVWFREQCPQGTIDTEELAVDLDRETEEEISVWNNETRKKEKVIKRANGYARYRAIVTDGKGGRATATKSEKAASFPDFCEKAETGAVGRALAMLGYGTQFTGDELTEGERIVDSPVSRPAQPLRNGDGSEAVPAINPTVVRMTEIAQARAQKLGIDWDLFKVSTLGVQVHDSKLGMHHFSKINGELTKREKETAKAATSGK